MDNEGAFDVVLTGQGFYIELLLKFSHWNCRHSACIYWLLYRLYFIDGHMK